MMSQLSEYVLIVEDDVDIVEIIELILQGSGYKSLAVRDGAHALECLRTGPTPRVVLLDIMMPRMDGTQFRNEQLKDPAIADVPVVVMSGDTRIAEKMALMGLKKCIRKPVDVNELLAVVRDPT